MRRWPASNLRDLIPQSTPGFLPSGRWCANGSNLYFYVNGALVWSGVDASIASGRAGIEFYSPSPLTEDQLWVDWATLSTVVSREILDTVSPEQQALNEAAQEGAGNKNYSPIGEQTAKDRAVARVL